MTEIPPYYAAQVHEFLTTPPKAILGLLTEAGAARGFGYQRDQQVNAWSELINALRDTLVKVPALSDAGIVIEYPIPRRNKRIDAVLVCCDTVVVLEFKVGAARASSADRVQAEDYCLDLRDFHSTSRGKTLVPVVVPTAYTGPATPLLEPVWNVAPVLVSSVRDLPGVLERICDNVVSRPGADARSWASGRYFPTPTIIEAACHLYAEQDVKEITRSHAEADNLARTTQAVIDAIERAKNDREKLICFITGVPGAGKTLAGLNIVHNSALHAEGDLGVFLSGNGPLVRVLKEALARDHASRTDVSLAEARRRSSTFVQNVHRFLDTYAAAPDATPDRVVIFDEAQRAWNAEHSYRKFKRPTSEPEMMMGIMDRHTDWAVVVCLIGGGQEINTGEAGLPEWGRVIETKFPHWRVLISDKLLYGSHSTAGQPLFVEPPAHVAPQTDPALHLNVSLRSFRAEKLSEWVAYVLDNEPDRARQIAENALTDYPLFYTRDLSAAKEWLRYVRRGTRRSGIIASSGGRRLRPYGIDVTADLKVEDWFLAPGSDVRSSTFLELAATEFAIQGLEIDWTCVCWDADLRRVDGGWGFYRFAGTRWNSVGNADFKNYMINKYRVLLTRAREGMVIWVPRGSKIDHTRQPSFYNDTAEYLRACGVRPLPETFD